MLEAAMLGIPYEGQIPDFSQQQAPPEPTSPSVLQQRELRDEQDQAYKESLEVRTSPCFFPGMQWQLSYERHCQSK